jgi:hypothetical protein
MDVRVSGADDGPVRLEVAEATTSAKPTDPVAGLAAWLSGGFVLLTGLLAAVGSYTGGVARIMRNDPGSFRLALLGVLAAVFFGVVAGEVAKSTWSKWKRAKVGVQYILLLLGIGIFLVSMYGAVSAAAYSSTLEDRPSLNAQLAASDLRIWSVKGTAATSGLASDERLQVLVYGVPSGSGDPVRIFFITTGPNSDGLASETFEAPLPAGEFDAIVVTANTGTLPRDCSGDRAFYVQTDPVALTEATNFVEEWQNACVTLAPPPEIPTG